MKRGLCSYAQLVGRLMKRPATGAEMVERFGITESHARRVPRALLDLGVLSVVEWRHDANRGPAIRVYGVNPVPGVPQVVPTRTGQPSRHVGAKSRVRSLRPEMIAFAAVWHALQDASTAAELSEETGVCFRTMQGLLATLAQLKLIGVAGWTRKRPAGPYTPQYQRGVTRNANRPQNEAPGVAARRYQAKLTERRQHALLAGNAPAYRDAA